MAWFTPSSRFTILALALTLGPALNVSAQLPQSSSSSLGSQLENSFRVPSRGLPENRQGGATRGGGSDSDSSCFTDKDRRLTALVPIGGGETAAEYPTIFWYMPRMIEKNGTQDGAPPAPAIEFTLTDANDREIYSANYPLTKSADGFVGTPGIMSLTVAKPLQVGQDYKWQLTLKCDSKGSDNSDNQRAIGGLKRVAQDPNLQLRAQQASPEERLILYAQANLWYELLANLIALRRDRPNDPTVVEAWNKVFVLVGLDPVSKQPRVQGTRTSTNSN